MFSCNNGRCLWCNEETEIGKSTLYDWLFKKHNHEIYWLFFFSEWLFTCPSCDHCFSPCVYLFLEVYIEKSQFKTLFELWFKQLTMKKYWKGFQTQRLRHEWLNDNLKAAAMQKLVWKIETAKRHLLELSWSN